MRLNSMKYLTIFAISLITLPVCSAHTNSASWKITQPVSVGNTQVQPGDYRFEIMQGRKPIASILCYWTDLPMKAADTEIKVNNNRVTEVQFKGRPEAILFFPS